jgi:hypothetical protein
MSCHSQNNSEKYSKVALTILMKNKEIIVNENLISLHQINQQNVCDQHDKGRLAELNFMKNWISGTSTTCLWLQVLLELGDNVDLQWKCGNCTYCKERGAEEPLVNPAINDDCCFRQFTPNNKIPVYAVGLNNENPSLSTEKVIGILQGHVSEIGASM